MTIFKSKILSLAGVLGFCTVLGGGLYFGYHYLNQSKIEKLQTQAEFLFVNEEELKSKITALDPHFFSLSTQSIADYLKQNPAIDNYFIAKIFPNTIKVIIHEHKPYAVWTNGKQSGYISEKGKFFYSPQQIKDNQKIAEFLRAIVAHDKKQKKEGKEETNGFSFNKVGISSASPYSKDVDYLYDPKLKLYIPSIPETQPSPSGKTVKGKVKLCIKDSEENHISLERMKLLLEEIDQKRRETKEAILAARNEGRDIVVDYKVKYGSKEEDEMRSVAKLDFCQVDTFSKNSTPGISADLLNLPNAPYLNLQIPLLASEKNKTLTSVEDNSSNQPLTKEENQPHYYKAPIFITNRFYAPKALEYWKLIEPIIKESGLEVEQLRLDSLDSWQLLLSNKVVLKLDSKDIVYTLKRFLIATKSITIPENYFISYIDLRYNNHIAFKFSSKKEIEENPKLITETLIPGRGAPDLVNADSDPLRVFPNYENDE